MSLEGKRNETNIVEKFEVKELFASKGDFLAEVFGINKGCNLCYYQK